jgi:uncharacterized protein (DUF2147 family)
VYLPHCERPIRPLILAIGAAAAALCLTPAEIGAQSRPGNVTGVWLDHTGQGAVEIVPCGAKVCGRVVWLKDPKHKSKSGKPICGTQILGDLEKRTNDIWEAGWIYNPEDEEQFSAELKLQNDGTLLVTGYLGIKLLGETFTWTRAPGTLQRCAT